MWPKPGSLGKTWTLAAADVDLFAGCSGMSSGARAPALGGRSPQSSFDSNGDVGQVTLNWMRVNGAMPGFKHLLTSTSSNSPASLPRHQPGRRPPCLSPPGRDGSLGKVSAAAAAAPASAGPLSGEFVKRKDSLGRPRKFSDAVRTFCEHGRCGAVPAARPAVSGAVPESFLSLFLSLLC